ncbi:hypothetical protein ACQKFK_29950 [Bacillus mycoides]
MSIICTRTIWNPDLLKFNREYIELTKEEKEKYNGHLIDELEVER